MAYSVYPIASLADIPPLVGSFAAALGWNASSSNPAGVTHPTYVGAKTFSVTTETGGAHPSTSYEDLILNCTGATNFARVRSPKLNLTGEDTDAAVTIMQPTQLHLFGALSGNASDSGFSFVAGVIEYGYNLYRHFYLGYAEKITPYGGGEIITGSHCIRTYLWTSVTSDASTTCYDNEYVGYPFSANVSSAWVNNGGMHIDHAGNPNPWREFTLRSNLSTYLDTALATNREKVVLGGFMDSINTGYMVAGKAPYSGAQVLAPINLYITKETSGKQYLQAVGRPAGARMIHIEDLSPGSEITVGSSKWRVFPMFSKSPEITMPVPAVSTGRGLPKFNTSSYAGMAYLVSA